VACEEPEHRLHDLVGVGVGDGDRVPGIGEFHVLATGDGRCYPTGSVDEGAGVLAEPEHQAGDTRVLEGIPYFLEHSVDDVLSAAAPCDHPISLTGPMSSCSMRRATSRTTSDGVQCLRVGLRIAEDKDGVALPIAVKRHAGVSQWLNSGVPSAEVAARAGHSVEVLLKIYAKCVDGQEAAMNERTMAGLGEAEDMEE
jgi:hypothetical protein